MIASACLQSHFYLFASGPGLREGFDSVSRAIGRQKTFQGQCGRITRPFSSSLLTGTTRDMKRLFRGEGTEKLETCSSLFLLVIFLRTRRSVTNLDEAQTEGDESTGFCRSDPVRFSIRPSRSFPSCSPIESSARIDARNSLFCMGGTTSRSGTP